MTSDSSESNNPDSKQNLLGRFKESFGKRSKKNIIESQEYEKLDTPLQDMIHGVFKLSKLITRDIMIPRVDIVAVDSTTGLKPLVKMVCNAGHSRVPVYEETIDNIVGILYVKDLLKLLGDTSSMRKKFLLKKHLHEPFFVPGTMPLDELLREFKIRKLHIAVVVDEYGGIGGIVTLEDILEEIVGDIVDEFDADGLPEIEKISKNIYEVDSRLPITEFNDKLGLNLSNDDFDTIGGYVFDLFGKIPEKDESVKDNNITFTIKDISGTVINRIKISITRTKTKNK